MTKINVLTDYSRESDSELGVFAQSVYNALNPNPSFTWDESVMPKFQNDITAYLLALEKVLNGTPAETLAKNEARETVLSDLRTIAMEVNLQGDNDAIKLQSSGLQMAKPKSKVGILPKPTGFTVKSGENSGDLLCMVNPNSNASVYNFYSAATPAPSNIAEWRLTPSTAHKKNITGYTPGKQYELKCAYQGSDETLVYSDAITIFAQ